MFLCYSLVEIHIFSLLTFITNNVKILEVIILLFAIVHPLEDINLMTPCYIIQVIFFSWTATAGFAVLQISLRVSLKTRDLSLPFFARWM